MSSAGWKDIKYRQDLPPPGGYSSVPYKRNLPIRGPTGFVILGLGIAIHGLAYYTHSFKAEYNDFKFQENRQAEYCMIPLLDAERDRAMLRNWKEHIESEALNIVGSGFDPTYVPGEADVFYTSRYHDPFMGGVPGALNIKVKKWYTQFSRVPRCGP